MRISDWSSDVCSSDLMMQTLVIAHAAYGHNHFFKNNYLFKQWTDADGILDYLEFAKGYIMNCEERYGHDAVERLLDGAHALMHQGVHRYPRSQSRSEEHPSELQSLMRISYAVFCLKNNKNTNHTNKNRST